MILPAGFFIAFGILAYLILWRYIFLQFFKLVKQSEDYQEAAELKSLDFLFSNCSESIDEKLSEPCKIVTNISSQVESMILCFESQSILTLQIQSARHVIEGNSFLLDQLYRRINPRNRVVEEVEHFYEILDAYKSLKLFLRSRIGHYGNSIVTKKNKSRIPKLRDMESTDDSAQDIRKPENHVFSDIAETRPDTSEDMKLNVQFDREEKDLNTMIRRLVAAELIKCCEKEYATMNRAHSETNNRINWKRIPCRDGLHRRQELSDCKNAAYIGELETEMIEKSKTVTVLRPSMMEETFEDAATQTEHMYMIRAVRSCPGRKKCLQLLATPRGMFKTKSTAKLLPMEISLSAFLYRKASDNLIYEKGKGSRSPSYIPVPERFRWRYLMPRKVTV